MRNFFGRVFGIILCSFKPILDWWFHENKELKIVALLFWTIGLGQMPTLEQDKKVPLYQVVILYVVGYFIWYFICAAIALCFKNKKQMQNDEDDPQIGVTLQQVDVMTGSAFEDFCIGILQKSGFEKIRKTKATGDQGIDITAEKHNIKYAFQCKRYNKPVGNHAIMEAYSGKAYYGCDIGVVITNSSFTPQAAEHAKRTGIWLWDRTFIFEMLKNN